LRIFKQFHFSKSTREPAPRPSYCRKEAIFAPISGQPQNRKLVKEVTLTTKTSSAVPILTFQENINLIIGHL